MKHLGHGITGLVGFFAGWFVRPGAAKPNDEEIGITLKMENGRVTKKMFSMQATAKTKDKVTWAIRNATGAAVVACLVDFRVTGTGDAKTPLLGDLCTREIQDGRSGKIHTEVADMLNHAPAANHRDEFDRLYQDFTYSIRVAGDGWEETIDPEIRIREC